MLIIFPQIFSQGGPFRLVLSEYANLFIFLNLSDVITSLLYYARLKFYDLVETSCERELKMGSLRLRVKRLLKNFIQQRIVLLLCTG